jgi:hypothetical protein
MGKHVAVQPKTSVAEQARSCEGVSLAHERVASFDSLV